LKRVIVLIRTAVINFSKSRGTYFHSSSNVIGI